MGASRIVEIDTYETEKLRLLPTEKSSAFMAAFMVFGSIAVFFAAITLLVFELQAGSLYEGHHFSNAIVADGLLVFMSFVALCLMLPSIYFARSLAQLERKKFNRTRVIVVMLGLIGFAVPIAIIMADAHEAGQSPFFVFWLFGTFFHDIGVLYASHGWSLLELLLGIVVWPLAWGNQPKMFYRKLWTLAEADRAFLRDDPDRGFYRGRVFRSALGIPRITDFVPHGQAWLCCLFIAGSLCYALQQNSMFVYLAAIIYPLLQALARCPDFSTLLICADPIFPAYATTSWLIVVLGFLPLALGGPYLGALLFGLAQRKIRFSIAERTKTDPRKPILFLRAFKDDQVKLAQAKLKWSARIGRWLDNISDLDRMLLEEGTPYGPVVAIGKPGDEWPPYGAARGYFDNKTWQSAVLDLAEDSRAVVLCADNTEGVWWEIEHIAARYPEKTLLLIHPNHGAGNANVEIVDKLAAILERSLCGLHTARNNLAQRADHAPTVLGFFSDKEGVLNLGVSSTFSRIAFLVMVRSFFRKKWGLVG